jgi:IS5 family transposase
MRLKSVPVLSFAWTDDSLPKIVRESRSRYKRISTVLDENPLVLELMHKDLAALSSQNRKGRRADYTSENILRTLVVMSIEGLPLRETVVRIGNSPFLQDFVRLEKRATMDFTFLDKCLCAIRPETWKAMNEALGRAAVAKGQVDPSVVRADTTVVETNIHYPTDSSLLWDAWRVATRVLARARAYWPASCPHRFHTRKIKKLHLFVTRYSSSRSKARQRKVGSSYRTLIARVGWMLDVVREFLAFAREQHDLELTALAAELKGYLPAMERVVAVAHRVHVNGEKVPARERVFSLFEPHTELIKRGKRDRPVEFGHMVWLAQSREKFITDYEVMEEREPDSGLAEPVVGRHEALYGVVPDVFAADAGFSPGAEKRAELEAMVETLAIPRRTADFADAVMRGWQWFRAGIEGTISALKRAFRLFRCLFRGFRHFASGVGLSIFGHNLLVLADQAPG